MPDPNCKGCGGTGTVETSHGRDYACPCSARVTRDVTNLEAQEREWKTEIAILRGLLGRARVYVPVHAVKLGDEIAAALKR